MYFFYKHILCNVISRNSVNIYYIIIQDGQTSFFFFLMNQTSLTIVLHPIKDILKSPSPKKKKKKNIY